MRILHVSDSLNPAGLGGYESYLHYLSLELDGRSHDNDIVTQAQKRNSPPSETHEAYEVHYLKGNLLEARKWEFLSHPEEKRKALVDQFFASNDLEQNIQLLASEMDQLIEKIRPDIIHCHSTYVVFNRVLAKIQSNGLIKLPPIILTVHGLPKSLILPSGEETTDYATLSHALPFDLILAVSDAVETALRNHSGISDSGIPIKKLYLGIDLDVFHPKKVPKKWDLAFMGRLERMKSVHIFPEVLSKLQAEHSNFKFVMTGEGSQKEVLLEKIKNRGLLDAVDYLGVVPAKQVPDILNSSRIFMYPSKREPFGLSILEAMACQIAVVTTNVYGPCEIVTSGVDGLMVEPEDAESLVQAISSLLKNPKLREEIGHKARLTVENRFDLRNHADSLLNIYRGLM